MSGERKGDGEREGLSRKERWNEERKEGTKEEMKGGMKTVESECNSMRRKEGVFLFE